VFNDFNLLWEGAIANKIQVLICRSNPVAPDPRVEKEARCLSMAGYSASVLGWDRSGLLPTRDRIDCVEVLRRRIRAGYARGLMNLLPLLRWQVDLLKWLLCSRGRYDLIHACDFDTILPALFYKVLYKKKVIYDIFDFYADHLRATPERIKRLIRLLDFWAIEHADAVILVDDARHLQIAGAHPQQVVVIYNSPEDISATLTPNQVSHDSGLRLSYVGLIQVERGLLQVLEVMSCHPEWTLELAGFGGDEAIILERARELPNVKWHGRVPYHISIELSARADVLFALYDPCIPNHRFSSPNKVFEAMMLSKPLVVARGTNMDRIVEQADAGLVVEYGDVAALENAFLRLEKEPDYRLRLGRNSRRVYEQKYSWNAAQERLLGLYLNLMGDMA
jgi:glycosyltransferase involved in cell wall biosynthesis